MQHDVLRIGCALPGFGGAARAVAGVLIDSVVDPLVRGNPQFMKLKRRAWMLPRV